MTGAHVHHPATPERLFTPGMWVLVGLAAIGGAFAIGRFLFGLEAVTHLDQQHPWGLWIAFDVATGVALAAGGFTTAAAVHVFGRRQYGRLLRPALLTALLGYIFVVLGLLVDLGRYYNVWHPLLPDMWQGHSVLFEVGICVVCYLTVLTIEFLPVVCARLADAPRWPRLQRAAGHIGRALERVMFLFIIAGVVLSCLHQSSLGNLMVLAPSKMHPLWYTPVASLLFLLSAIAVGIPMVIVESLCCARALRLPSETALLGRLSRCVPVLLGVYLAVRLGDIVIRGSLVHLAEWSIFSVMFSIEVVVGAVVPLVMLLSARVRGDPRWLLTAALLVVAGVVINRLDVFLVAYRPPFAERTYVPSIGEFAVSLGLMAGLVLSYRLIVAFFPVISRERPVRAS